MKRHMSRTDNYTQTKGKERDFIYLSTTTIFRHRHITLVVVVFSSSELSGMTVCTTISLTITAHELSFTFTLSPLHAHILINIGGIDIYCLRKEEKKDFEYIMYISRSSFLRHKHNEDEFLFFALEAAHTKKERARARKCNYLPVP